MTISMLFAGSAGIDYDQATLVEKGFFKTGLRVKVEDADGTMIDLTDLAHDQDFVESIDLSDDIDSPGGDCGIALRREIYDWSLARDMETSPLNLDANSQYAPLLSIGRKVQVEFAYVPEEHTLRDWDYVPLFDGIIDTVDWGDEIIKVQCRSMIAAMQDVYTNPTRVEIISVDDSGTGNILEITTKSAHGLDAGDEFSIYGTTNFNGTWRVATAPSSTTLTTEQAATGSPAIEYKGWIFAEDQRTYGDPSGSAVETEMQAIIDDTVPTLTMAITAIDDTGAGGTIIVSTAEDHGLEVGDTVVISDTTNYDATVTVAEVVDADTFRTSETSGGSYSAETYGWVTYVRGYLGGTPTIYTPMSPSWQVREWNQLIEPAAEAISNLATQIGWVIRYKWDSDVGDFRLTFYEPDRDKSTADHTFSSSDYFDVRSVDLRIDTIRNSVRVIFSNRNGNAQPDQKYPRDIVVKRDNASVRKYGLRECQVAEASTSNIDTFTEAVALAEAILADLKEPKISIDVEMPFFPWVELGDYYTFQANGIHWSSDKSLAVTGYTHTMGTDGQVTTTLRLRGQPAAYNTRWLRQLVAPGVAPNTPRLKAPTSPTGVTFTSVVGGMEISWAAPVNNLNANYFYTEVHVSTTSGFTPSSSTLKERVSGTRVFIAEF